LHDSSFRDGDFSYSAPSHRGKVKAYFWRGGLAASRAGLALPGTWRLFLLFFFKK